jgi:hypothetical protein
MLPHRDKPPGPHLPAADEPLESGVVKATRRLGADASARLRISVVIPCYNYAQFMDEAIRSALDQAGLEVDVTIVDDGSIDGSLRISREWVERDSRVRLNVHRRNMGHIATFNRALEAIRSPYVLKLDPSDLLTAGCCRDAQLSSTQTQTSPSCTATASDPRVNRPLSKFVAPTLSGGGR